MTTDCGRSPSGSGYSAEPEPCSTVSAVPVSIPNAEREALAAIDKLLFLALTLDDSGERQAATEAAHDIAVSALGDHGK